MRCALGAQKRGLSGTWRTFCSSAASRQPAASLAAAGGARACAPHVTHEALSSDSARTGAERPFHAHQHVGISCARALVSCHVFLSRKCGACKSAVWRMHACVGMHARKSLPARTACVHTARAHTCAHGACTCMCTRTCAPACRVQGCL